MEQVFGAMALPDEPEVRAPDGSDVRVLLRLSRGSMAHFELGAGRVSRAVAHHHVEELWYILNGRGEMWRRLGAREETVALTPGTCLSIPAWHALPVPCARRRPAGGRRRDHAALAG